MLFHSIKQYVILFCQLASSNLIPRLLLFWLKLRIFNNKIKYVSITVITLKQQACIMFRTHLIHVFFFSGQYEKGLFQNFVRERIKFVYRINNTRLAFLTSITTIHRPQTSELKSISKFQLLFHWKNFEKYMIFYTLPWSRWNRTHKYVRCTVRDSRIRSEMSWSSIHTKIWTLKQLHHCTQRLNHEDI